MRHLLFVLPSLLLLFLTDSCTVEKRIHRRGYHIEWRNKNQSTGTVGESRGSSNEIRVETQSREVVSSANELSEVLSSKAVKNEIIDNPVEMRTLNGETEILENAILKDQNFTADAIIYNQSEDKAADKAQSEKQSSGGFKRGLYMLIMGLLLIGLGYLFYSLLGVFGLILFIIFGIGGGIMVIIGIVQMIFGS